MTELLSRHVTTPSPAAVAARPKASLTAEKPIYLLPEWSEYQEQFLADLSAPEPVDIEVSAVEPMAPVAPVTVVSPSPAMLAARPKPTLEWAAPEVTSFVPPVDDDKPTTTGVPSPTLVARLVNLKAKTPSTPSRNEVRGCLEKVLFDTEAMAMDAAARVMIQIATKPMRYYACRFCAGWHLTTSDKSSTSLEPPKMVSPVAADDFVKDTGKRKHAPNVHRSMQKHRLAIKKRGKELHANEARLGRLMYVPTPASPEEAAAWFAEHQPGWNAAV